VALLVTVAAGAALALPLVAATSGAVARGLLGLGNMTPRSTAAPAWLYALIAGLGLVVPLLVALIPLRHGLGVSVRTALNDYGVDLGATARRPPRAAGRLSRPVLLSLRNALRRKGRLALNLTLLTASGIMFTTVVTAMLSVDQSLDDNLAAFRYDYSIAIDPRTDPADLAQAVAAAGTVEDYEVWRGTTAELMGADGRAQASYPVIAPAEASRMIEPDLEAGRWIAPGDTDAIVVSHRFLTAQPDYQVGGRLGLRLGGAVHTFTIVGAISDFSEAALYLDPGRFDDLVPADAASATVRLVTASAQNRTQHYAAIDAAFAAAGVPVQRSASQADVQEIFASHYLVTLRTFLFVIVLIVAVAGFGLAATMNVQAFERTREVGVMKALGGGARQIKRIVTAEAVFVGLIACALTAVLGVGASWAGLQVFGAQVMRVDLDFRPLTYGLCCLMWLALTLLVGYAASRNAARRAAGTPIRTALSYDQ
jgi:putative ABC transport system permease protein